MRSHPTYQAQGSGEGRSSCRPFTMERTMATTWARLESRDHPSQMDAEDAGRAFGLAMGSRH